MDVVIVAMCHMCYMVSVICINQLCHIIFVLLHFALGIMGSTPSLSWLGAASERSSGGHRQRQLSIVEHQHPAVQMVTNAYHPWLGTLQAPLAWHDAVRHYEFHAQRSGIPHLHYHFRLMNDGGANIVAYPQELQPATIHDRAPSDSADSLPSLIGLDTDDESTSIGGSSLGSISDNEDDGGGDDGALTEAYAEGVVADGCGDSDGAAGSLLQVQGLPLSD